MGGWAQSDPRSCLRARRIRIRCDRPVRMEHLVPDQRQHRGPHPEDNRLFDSSAVPALRKATADLSWLLTNKYSANSASKLVGDRYLLTTRQRLAVSRCAASDQQRSRRAKFRLCENQLSGNEIWIDGFNVITTLEAALSGGVILLGRDGCYRDMASMHGNYRKVQETAPAISLVGNILQDLKVISCRWLFDQPVSNSGRLKTLIGEIARSEGWSWSAELVPDPDKSLIRSECIVATADSQVLDHTERWFNLARFAIDSQLSDVHVVDLS